MGVESILKEPEAKNLKADCKSCKTEKAGFTYLGLNKMILDTGLGIDFFLEKYGQGALFLYGCVSCNTSQTLASLKPYPL